MTGSGSRSTTEGPTRDLPTPGDGDRSPRIFVLLGFGLLAVGLAFWHPIPAGVWHDDGVYMLIGRALASGQGLHYAGVVGAPPAVKFPPGYPLLLALLWTVFRSLGAVTLAAELLNLALLAAAGALLGWALYRNAGLDRRLALGIAVLAFVSADVWRWALVPLSESLFMALAAATLVAWGPASRPGEGKGAAALAGLLVLAVLTRTAGVALVAGFAVALMRACGWRRSLAVCAPPALVALAWGRWAAARAAEVPAGMRDILGPYGGWLGGQLATPGAFVASVPAHLTGVLARILALLLPGLEGPGLWVAGAPLTVLAVLGFVRLARILPPLPWISCAYLGMVVLWPFMDRRLVAPLHPWVVAAVCVGFQVLAGRVGRASLRRMVGALALVWVGLYVGVSASRASRGWAAAAYELRARRLAAAVEALDHTAPPDAVVGAPEFWPALHLHGGWRVIPSARFMPLGESVETPVWGTPLQQASLWWNARVTHVLLEQGGAIHGATLDLLDAKCPGTVHVLAELPPQILVGLGWTESCARALGLMGG